MIIAKRDLWERALDQIDELPEGFLVYLDRKGKLYLETAAQKIHAVEFGFLVGNSVVAGMDGNLFGVKEVPSGKHLVLGYAAPHLVVPLSNQSAEIAAEDKELSADFFCAFYAITDANIVIILADGQHFKRAHSLILERTLAAQAFAKSVFLMAVAGKNPNQVASVQRFFTASEKGEEADE